MSRVLEQVTFVQAHISNFSQKVRSKSAIKYIVVHYTGNTNDTARNNAIYFRDNPVVSSAHYFVSKGSIYQCVPDNHPAYAVGLGKRKEPYDKNVVGWGIINNSNSISVELCGGPHNNEALEEVKILGAKLVCDLLEKYGLNPSCVYRHYDVTGKWCPWWAVEHPDKWTHFKVLVNKEFYGKEEDELKNTPENYAVFKQFMDKYFQELAEKETPEWASGAMTWAQQNGLINDGRALSHVNRAELATVLMRNAQAGIH